MKGMVNLKVGEVSLAFPQDVVLQQLLESLRANGAQATFPTVPAPGEYWDGQGGVNAGLMKGINGVGAYFLIKPTDKRAHIEAMAWGPRGKKITGADCQWDGQKNTQAILASGLACPMAQHIAGLTIEGHKDLYLAARREYSLLYANVPEDFDTSSAYWTSTQYDAAYAWYQEFNDGSQSYSIKDREWRGWAVRRVPLSHLIIK